jgi:hypothetical protein
MTRCVPAKADETEVDAIATELAKAYRRMAEFYRDELQLDGPEADARARGSDRTLDETIDDLARIQDRPSDQVSWFDLTRLAERDPHEMRAVWQRLRDTARREFESGHRAAAALEWQGGPWDRARFLAVRDTFRGDGPPPNGIEAALIDSAAESFSEYLEWIESVHRMERVDMTHEKDRSERYGEWQPQRLSYAEAVDRAQQNAEKAHARFLRTVKMLHELQRATLSLYVANAGQINVANQQVNVARAAADGTPDEKDLSK